MRFILFIFVAIAFHSNAQYGGAVYESIKKQFDEELFAEIIDLKTSALAFADSRQDSLAANVYTFLGYSYYYTGQTDSAISFFERELAIRQSLKAIDYSEYSNTLYNLMSVYSQAGLYAEAIKTGRELMREDREHYGAKSKEFGESALFYLRTLIDQGNFKEARTEAEGILTEIGKSHEKYWLIQVKYADVLAALGEYTRAEKLFRESIVGIRSGNGLADLDEATASINMADMYVDEGLLIEAEEIYSRSMQVFKKSDSPEAIEMYFTSLNNFGIALLRLSRVDEAIRVFDELLDHDKETYGQNHPFFVNSLINAGTAMSDAGDFTKAESYLQLALELEKKQGEDSYALASILNNLGKLYYLSAQPAKSIPLLEQAAAIFGEEVGPESLEYSTVIYNQGMAMMMRKSPSAKELLNRALTIREKKFGSSHPRYGETTGKLAIYEWMMANPKGAQNHFQVTFSNYYEQIERYFPGLSEAEKTKFYYQGLRPAFEIFNSFVVQHRKQFPDLLGKLYDIQLNTKGLILYSTNKVRSSIQKHGDQMTLRQYEDWLILKERISKLYSSSDETQGLLLDSLERMANATEKELTKKSASFGKNIKRKWLTWKEVQSKLGPQEAAVEIVRFREYTPDSGGYYTGQVRYAALVVKKKSKRPELILLTNPGNKMEKQNLSFYRNAIKFEIEDNLSYDLYWKPLAENLEGTKKVYFSPDGVFNQLNLNSLRNPASGKYLLEEIIIENVTNTKDILGRSTAMNNTRGSTYLYGFPQYAIETRRDKSALDEPATRKISRGERAGILRFLRGENGIVMLPGTKTEIQKISSILEAANQTPTVRLSEEAQEASLKALDNADVLHIATHGFFLDDPDFSALANSNRYIENPLLRAGLIMAGAEDFLRTGELAAQGDQDGILTAQEVMDLSLDATELVVLSACETGLGTVQNGEGVYGLRRAFGIAGAKCVIMSMWNVDDEATQELMTQFYSNWLKGATKQEAFRQAQFQLKEKYPNPFYWSAFVMIGE